MRDSGTVTITDPRMTRFWLTLEHSVSFVLKSLESMRGGEIFVPKIPSMSLSNLADAIAPDCRKTIVGIRPGEKVHEVLLTEDEARIAREFDDFYVIEPGFGNHTPKRWTEGAPVPEDFQYSSQTNRWRLTPEDLLRLVNEVMSETDDLSIRR
jgi:UDP-N-acetylglucosamine 4,6-dehydratase